jgi:glycosyltransferase A (GT-A) superfamily protein (DUF2064 family)
MAKEPIPGRVKTRLCPPCTPAEAAHIAEAALVDTLQAVVDCTADRRVLAIVGRPGAWLPAGFDVIDQHGADFAARLANAWSEAGGPGFQIGMDTPQITPALLDAALDQLAAGQSAVLGRALDGGWWGVGFQEPPVGAFDGVTMSRSDTADQQVARLESLGMSVHEVAPLRDVDTWEDALAVAAEVPDARFGAAVTSVASSSMGSSKR